MNSIDKEKLLVEIVESNLSSESKVYLMDLVRESNNQTTAHTIIDEKILNPTSSWGRKGTKEYESQLECFGH
jgi:hypothetical protein